MLFIRDTKINISGNIFVNKSLSEVIVTFYSLRECIRTWFLRGNLFIYYLNFLTCNKDQWKIVLKYSQKLILVLNKINFCYLFVMQKKILQSDVIFCL